MKKLFCLLTVAMLPFAVHPAAEKDKSSAEIKNTDVVPSGTYTGTAERVDPKEKEIYVKTDDGKTLELYFKDSTKLMQNGQPASFDALKKGQQVEVKVEKKGERLEPMSVNIMQK